MKRVNKKQPIRSNIKETEKYLTERLGIGVSYDVDFREIIILKQKIQLYYLNGLCDSSIIQRIMQILISINDDESNLKKVPEIIENRLLHEQVFKVETMDEAVDQLLSGLIIIFVNGEKYAFVVDVRQYPGRSPDEPDTERVIRGARDGYTENIIENTALTRRRVRDERLRHEMMQIGERSKTDICVCYIQDIADDNLVKLTKDKVDEIDIDGIPMADKTVEEFIVAQKWNAFPLVRYTERPDTAAKHLFAGHIVLIVDTSPSVIILPTTYFDHLEHAEEFRQAPAVGTFIRFVRLFAILTSIYLLPLWLLFVMDPSLLPQELSYIGPNEEGNIPILVQILLATIGMEFLRMAAIHTPTALATALGLIAAVLIGEIAVEVGMFSPEVILYVAISTVGSYVTPSYELSVANKLLNIFLLLATVIFGLSGFITGVVATILYLASIKTLNTPYLWPFIPFDAKALIDSVLRIPVPYANIRPRIVYPKDKYSQPRPKRK